MITAIDLFAGIGGFRIAFERAAFRIVFSSEIDRFARQTYSANFDSEPAGDIREINSGSIPGFDVLCAGFPCQPFSIAGVSKKNSMGRMHGFDDSKSGDLFFEITRILRDKKPRAFVLENVKNLASHDHGRTLRIIRRELDSLGYNVLYQPLNARHWVPQNRERIYMIGFRRSGELRSFIGKFERALDASLFDSRQPVLRDILDKESDPKFTLSDRMWNALQNHARKHRSRGNGFGFKMFSHAQVSRTLSARYGKDGGEILIEQPGQNPRRLNPRECARLMGFPDSFKIVVSDTQAYKQFGNSVVVPVLELIAGALREVFAESDASAPVAPCDSM